MTISRLKISDVRNLTAIDLEPCSGLNLFYGENGSGKTSVLEAISLLAHGRSFRTINYRQLIQHSSQNLAVFGELKQAFPLIPANPEPSHIITQVGILRPLRGSSVFKIDGSPVYSSASLASLLPLQVMNAKSFDLLEGPSKVRRKMFDWLVFHVKHEFNALWRDYTKALKQRNVVLRHDKIDRSELAVWGLELNRLALNINALRQACMTPFMDRVNCLISELGLPENYTITIKYQRGWSDEAESLSEVLSKTLDRDKQYGFTTQGAHKSELKVLVNNMPAADILSRGQQKSVIAAFLVAELQLFEEMTQRESVLLIDDLPAELDQEHIQLLAKWLSELNTQIFATGIYSADMEILQRALNNKPCKLFHVKHGEIEQSSPS